MAVIYRVLAPRFSPLELDQMELWHLAAILGRGTREVHEDEHANAKGVTHTASDEEVKMAKAAGQKGPILVARAKGSRRN